MTQPEQQTIRVLRILEYSGPIDRVMDCLARSHVKREILLADMVIREALIMDGPTMMRRDTDNKFTFIHPSDEPE